MMKSQLAWCLATLLGALAIGLTGVARAGKASIALEQSQPGDQARFGKCLTVDGRVNFMLASLQNGEVLVSGGMDDKTEKHALASAAICDPSTGRLTPVGNMVFARCCASATVLRDGQVLIAGGVEKLRINSLKTAEVYNPARRDFERVGDMNESRVCHIATLLNDGRVLIAGGSRPPRIVLNSAEIYDPITRSFTPTGSMQSGLNCPHADLLHDGRVLISDGYLAGEGFQPSGWELYTSAVGTFSVILDKSQLPPR